MSFHFTQPWNLLLLGLLPLMWWYGRRLRSVPSGRRWTTLILRTLMTLFCVFALADTQWTKRSRDLAVFYVLDESDSVPSEQRKQAYEAIKETASRSHPDDEKGLIVFGAEPSIENSPVKKFEFEGKIQSAVTTKRTNIASALRLAMAAFPPNVMKRIVLLTDGNENDGSAIDVARVAKGNVVPIDVLPMKYFGRQDLQISKLIAPQQSVRDAPFDVKVFVEAQKDTTGHLRLYQDNQVVAERDVPVYANKKNVFLLPRRLDSGGFHNFRATIETTDDARPENNTAYGFTFVKSRPRVLYVEGDNQGTNYLAPALKTEDIDLDLKGPDDIPTTLEQLQSYDSLILSNIPASSMSASQMNMIERAVHDMGIGLVMIGGEHAFGAGGYQDTPVEKALPVSMDIKQKKVLPNGALAIVLHTCEIPQGNSWAREISMAALGVLSRQDMFGLLYYGSSQSQLSGGWGEYWAWEPGLQICGDKRKMRSLIQTVQPSDMPSFDPTLQMAYKELVKAKAQAKHIIVISDGDPGPPKQSLANAIRDAGISVSTVAIAPHNGQTVDTLKKLAFDGGGNFYYPKNSNMLPKIFIKEASVVRRSLISEEDFSPVGKQYSEILTGIPGVPKLGGHVVTTIKDLATDALNTADKEGDPVLSHWRYGLGKTVAFTSDAKNKWAGAWVSWSNYAKFWAQLVRWSMRETSSSNHQVQASIDGSKGTIVVDALDDQGNFENFLEFEGTVISPNNERIPVMVRQVAPGRYEGNFSAVEVGTYNFSLSSDKNGKKDTVTGGVALSYSPEYQVSRSNDSLLESLSKESGGQLVEDLTQYNPFIHNLPSETRPTPLWPWLTLLIVLLLPIDIFVRRVYVDWSEVGKWLQVKASGVIGTLRPARMEEMEERLSSLKDAKSRAGRQDKEEEGGEAPGGTGAGTGTVSRTASSQPIDEKSRAAAREALRRSMEQEGEASGKPPSESVFQAPASTSSPVRHRAKETFTPDSTGAGRQGAGPPQGAGFTGSLLEAKKRAKKKM